jgi:UDP-2,3-diacylglucosamine pyrophosphatase LpxH
MIIAVSDVHIGSFFTKKELFFKFISALPQEAELYLLGDIVDTWKSMPEEDFYSLFEALKGRVVYFPGNHDEEILIAKIVSSNICKRKMNKVLNKSILFTHGDIYDVAAGKDTLWNRFWDILFYKISLFLKIDIRTKIKSLISFYYNKVSSYFTRVEKALQEEGVDILIYGHTHCPGVKEIKNITLFNLGSWYDKPFAFFLKGDKYAFVEITDSFLQPEEKDFKNFR